MKSRIFPLIATIVVFILLYMIGWQRFPAFGTTRVVLNILTDKSFLGVAAVGMTFVILSGGIDLSVGSIIAFTSIFCALLIKDVGVHPLGAFAIALALGAAFGGGDVWGTRERSGAAPGGWQPSATALGEELRVDYGLSAFFVPQGKGKEIETLPREQVRLVVAVTGSGRSAPLRLLANGKVLLEDSAF